MGNPLIEVKDGCIVVSQVVDGYSGKSAAIWLNEKHFTRLRGLMLEVEKQQRETAEAERIASLPPVDRTALCTTDGRAPEDARASQTNETGQHASYVVLCDAERAKGFVRPYRDAYEHVGRKVERCEATRTDGDYENPRQCNRRFQHEGDHQFDALMLLSGPIHFLPLREGGCGSVTTMGRALSETYARDPKFYGATFCCSCNRHLPVAEFVWTNDREQVGS